MTRRAHVLPSLAVPPDAAPPRFPPHTRRLLEAIRAGRAGSDFFPPIARPGPERVLHEARPFQGADDAARLSALLARPEFQPLVRLYESLGEGCGAIARRHPGLFAARVVRITHGALFGPVLTEAFTLCATTPAADGPPPGVRALGDGFLAFFGLFVKRLARDAKAGLFQRAGFEGPITHLWTNPEETHNGRQHVLRVQFRRGGALAYKPRPASGESLFLAEPEGRSPRSFFDWVNHLPSASGEVRLPTLRVLRGRGRDGAAYSWQDWIERPPQWGTLRSTPRLKLQACQLPPPQAARFWHRAGALTATCFAVGASDLLGSNLVVGVRRGQREPLPYLVDLEVFFCPVRRLPETGLISDSARRGDHHVGFEWRAWWCTTGGPLLCFFPGKGGALQLRPRRRAWARDEARSVVADTEGNVGYAAYLLPFLRGMFDVWTKLLMERERVSDFLTRAARRHHVRVLVKPSDAYGAAQEQRLLSSQRQVPATVSRGRVKFSAEEREQLARFDVPYFFRKADGGPLLMMDAPPASPAFRPVGPQQFVDALLPPAPHILSGEQLGLMNLGVALRDAVDAIAQDLRHRVQEAPAWGVRLALEEDRRKGAVSFDWPETGKRLTFSWNRRTVRLSDAPLEAEPAPRRGERARRAKPTA
ncbi:DUF4135 domain-containing protein [Comamonas sp. JC664]|nr:DUF4135 domain-containing protein [Comamonas sp. JC664]MBL0695245.1 DUF4135 domain-containing protein [Comamonas sp. JC664]GHG86975.1 hypothetical protein GCM10012319_44380 [Comamonas sp. KCTC 72670]